MARKIIGKKQMDRIPELRQKIFNERKCSKEMIQYVWDTAVSVQLGYAFSLPHTVGYSAIALQELNLFNKYPSIYWNTACLVVNSGGEGSGTDYAKIAVALSRVRKHGISISTVDINKSEKEFKPDVQNNQVLYGFKPLTGISDEYIDEIIANRPYAGLVDFLDRVKTDKTKATSLIKSGAFDDLEGGRRLSLAKYAMLRTNYRKSIAITILPTLKKFDLLPQEMEGQHSIFEFNRYVKNQLTKDNGYYSFDERASDFFSKNFDTTPLILGPLGNEMILISDWEKIYKKGMNPAREWLKANKEDLFETLFYLESSKEFEEIGEGNISKWEMDAMSFYHSEHELANVDYERYNISDYTKLPSEPQRTKNGRYSRYVTCTIVGTCLARNKTKGQAYILTREGEVVLLKMPKGKFSYYDKQISEPIPGTDKKKIVERSWFGKGNKILVHGFRRGSQFIPKTYTDTAMPSVALITDVSDNGELKIRTERGV